MLIFYLEHLKKGMGIIKGRKVGSSTHTHTLECRDLKKNGNLLFVTASRLPLF